MPVIVQIHEWPATEIAELLVESEQEGFHFVRRAQAEWLSGANTFSKTGEALFAVFENDRLLAIAGINHESASHGRLRRFYVRREARRTGIGRWLLRHVLAFASRNFSRVSLRCDTPAADRFYRAVGFRRTDSDPSVTHVLDLRAKPPLFGDFSIAGQRLAPRLFPLGNPPGRRLTPSFLCPFKVPAGRWPKPTMRSSSPVI